MREAIEDTSTDEGGMPKAASDTLVSVILMCTSVAMIGAMFYLLLSNDGDDPVALPTKAEREAR